jgi:hypothetical protein
MLRVEAARGSLGGKLLDERCGCRGDQVADLGECYRGRAQQQSRDDRGRGDEADAGKVRVDSPVRTLRKGNLGNVAGTVRRCVLNRWPDSAGIN